MADFKINIVTDASSTVAGAKAAAEGLKNVAAAATQDAEATKKTAELFRVKPLYGAAVKSGEKALVKTQRDIIRPGEWTYPGNVFTRMSYFVPSPAPTASKDGMWCAGNSGFNVFAFHVPTWVTNVTGTVWIQSTNAQTFTFTIGSGSHDPAGIRYGANEFPAYPNFNQVVNVNGLIGVEFSVPVPNYNQQKFVSVTMGTTGNAATLWVVGPIEVTYE